MSNDQPNRSDGLAAPTDRLSKLVELFRDAQKTGHVTTEHLAMWAYAVIVEPLEAENADLKSKVEGDGMKLLMAQAEKIGELERTVDEFAKSIEFNSNLWMAAHNKNVPLHLKIEQLQKELSRVQAPQTVWLGGQDYGDEGQDIEAYLTETDARKAAGHGNWSYCKEIRLNAQAQQSPATVAPLKINPAVVESLADDFAWIDPAMSPEEQATKLAQHIRVALGKGSS